MDKEAIDLARQVAEAFREDSCIPFVGSGFSAAYVARGNTENTIPGMPTGRDLVELIRGKIGGLSESISLMHAFDVLETIKGQGAVKKFVLEHIGDVRVAPLPAHRGLSKLRCPAIITTNWDNLLEDALKEREITHRVVVTDKDIPISEHDKTLLIKLHGTIGRPSTIVATTEATLSVFTKRRLLESLVRVLLAQRSVLFLGYSLADPDFMQLYFNLRRVLGDDMPKSFAAQLNPSETSVLYWKNRGLQVINADATELVELIGLRVEIGDSDEDLPEAWVTDEGLKLFIGVEAYPNEGRVIEVLFQRFIQMLDMKTSLKIADIYKRVQEVTGRILELRPHHQVLRAALPELDNWFKNESSVCAIRNRINEFLNNRSQELNNLRRFGVECISPDDAILIYSNSTRVVDVLNEWTRKNPSDTITLYISECRPKSQTTFFDALQIAGELNAHNFRIRLIPDAAVANELAQGSITKVFLGAHSVREDKSEVEFTNTIGTLGIILAANISSTPSYVFAERSKFQSAVDSRTTNDVRAEVGLLRKTHPKLATLRKACKRIEYHNPGYDHISSEWCSFTLVSDLGIRECGARP